MGRLNQYLFIIFIDALTIYPRACAGHWRYKREGGKKSYLFNTFCVADAILILKILY